MERQQEYTAQPPNLGYVEFWNGTARDFADDARRSIEPGETIQWVEELRAVHNLADQPDLFEAVHNIVDKR